MFIWIAINVDEQLNMIKQKVVHISNQLNYDNFCLNLPLHISLKISFEVSDEFADGVISDVENITHHLDVFSIKIKQIEYNGEIVWIRMCENETLTKIHNELTELLFSKYNVTPHEYDFDYVFHTTLFMSNDKPKTDKVYLKIQNEKLPKQLIANKILIGVSPNGEIGTYNVLKEINLE